MSGWCLDGAEQDDVLDANKIIGRPKEKGKGKRKRGETRLVDEQQRFRVEQMESERAISRCMLVRGYLLNCVNSFPIDSLPVG